MKKTKVEIYQNISNKAHAVDIINRSSEEGKTDNIKELEETGYEYNENIHILLKQDTIIPYEFILYCLLIEDIIPDRSIFNNK